MESRLPIRAIRCATALLTLVLAGPAASQCSDGTTLGYGCGIYDSYGCCSGDVLYWCENNWACRISCGDDLYCGWNSGALSYTCGTSGDTAPNNDPSMDCLDQDGDGWNPMQGDCNDTEPTIHPTADEVCDGIDQDCDGNIDEGFDHDQDGYLNDPSCPGELDCDDYHDNVHPNAMEEPYDGIDQDCDGSDLTDVDGDGYEGGPDGSDCEDWDDAVNPGAVEDCFDGVDNDCDGLADGFDDECGESDDDDTDPADDDDDDTTSSTDDDLSAEPALFEPFGFGCKCRVAGIGGPAAVSTLLLLLALTAVRRQHRS